MGRGARGFMWKRHDLRRHLAERYQVNNRRFWAMLALCVGALFGTVVLALLIMS